MVFSSSTFLFVFLPLCLLAYYIVPKTSFKNIILLAASLVFYSWGEPVYVFLMLASIAANWIAGMLMSLIAKSGVEDGDDATAETACVAARNKSSSLKKLVLFLDVAFNLAILGFFKYESFLATSFNHAIGIDLIPDLQLPLPIGISFYTLQALSYVIDVYRGHVPAQKNPLYLGMYIAMFPQLVAGPIVRYSTIQEQILHRKESLEKFCSGIRLFCIGMAKKVLLANTVAVLADSMYAQGGSAIGAVGAWAGLVAFTFQIFFDFAGYSDMAIGLGKMFGFEYLRNFNYPYISRSVSEFWRRWHISLGSFFRDYVYIPLGGNRVSKARWAFNLFVVWFLTGFWHGAAWNFIAWGLFYGVLLAFEKLWLGKHLERLPTLIRHMYAICVFVAGWFLFWKPPNALDYAGALFGMAGATGTSTMWELQAWSYWPILLVCAIASTPVVPWLRERLMAWACGRAPKSIFSKDGLANEKQLSVAIQCRPEALIAEARSEGATPGRMAVLQIVLALADVACVAMLVVSVMAIASWSFNPFIYFRF